MKLIITLSTALICLGFALPSAHAQERIFAVSGKITSVNPRIRMTEVDTDDGTTGHFRWIATPAPAIDFNKSVREDAIDPDKFTTKGNHVIVYFFGEGDVRTLVAVHDLGPAPETITAGTVVKLNRKERTLIVKKNSGEEATFHLDPKTVVDTSDNGVMEDFKYDLNKNEPVRVTSSGVAGNDTAWLVTPQN